MPREFGSPALWNNTDCQRNPFSLSKQHESFSSCALRPCLVTPHCQWCLPSLCTEGTLLENSFISNSYISVCNKARRDSLGVPFPGQFGMSALEPLPWLDPVTSCLGMAANIAPNQVAGQATARILLGGIKHVPFHWSLLSSASYREVASLTLAFLCRENQLSINLWIKKNQDNFYMLIRCLECTARPAASMMKHNPILPQSMPISIPSE